MKNKQTTRKESITRAQQQQTLSDITAERHFARSKGQRRFAKPQTPQREFSGIFRGPQSIFGTQLIAAVFSGRDGSIRSIFAIRSIDCRYAASLVLNWLRSRYTL